MYSARCVDGICQYRPPLCSRTRPDSGSDHVESCVSAELRTGVAEMADRKRCDRQRDLVLHRVSHKSYEARKGLFVTYLDMRSDSPKRLGRSSAHAVRKIVDRVQPHRHFAPDAAQRSRQRTKPDGAPRPTRPFVEGKSRLQLDDNHVGSASRQRYLDRRGRAWHLEVGVRHGVVRRRQHFDSRSLGAAPDDFGQEATGTVGYRRGQAADDENPHEKRSRAASIPSRIFGQV